MSATTTSNTSPTADSKLYKTTLLVYTKIDTERYLFLLAAYNQPYPNGFFWSLPQTVCNQNLDSQSSLEGAIAQELGIGVENYDLNYLDLAQTGIEASEDERLAIIEISPQQFITLSTEYQNFTWCQDCECAHLQELFLIDLATFAMLERAKELIKNDFFDSSVQQPRGSQYYHSSNLMAA